MAWVTDFLQDLRYGLRILRRSPVFTAVAIVTLTLAIGANTAIFSLIDPLVFRSLPVREPGRLVEFTWLYPGDPSMNLFSLDNYALYRDHNHVFSDMAALAPFVSEARADLPALNGEIVSGNFFQMLGVRPATGRLLEPRDDLAAGAPAAVVSWKYWKDRFNLDPGILGSSIDAEDRTHRVPFTVHATVVGVAARDFFGVVVDYKPDVWISMAAAPRDAGVSLIARLKDGASMEQAAAEMRVLDRPRIDGFAQRDPQWRTVTLKVTSAHAGLSTPLHRQFGTPLLVVMAIVGALLLLACANIGSMLLARAAARRHEMALRVSLGAGRARIARQALTESLLLAAAGGFAGLFAARFAVRVLLRIMTSGTRGLGPQPRLDMALDARVLVFTTGVTLIAVVLFGLTPAITAFVSTPMAALKRGVGDWRARARFPFGASLVIAQIALSLPLLAVSELYVSHLWHLRDRSLGFERDGVLLVSAGIVPTDSTRDALKARFKEALARMQAIPGVRSATLSAMTPISGGAGSRFATVEGFQEPQQDRRRVSLNAVASGYFETLQTPLVAGRDFTSADETGGRVVIVNEALVRHYLAGRDPLGKHVLFDGDKQPYQIIGVVGDAKYQDVRTPAPATIYFYQFRQSVSSGDFALRTSVSASSMAPTARRIIEDTLGAGSVKRVTTLAEQVDGSIVPERLMAALAAFFGGVAALLAAIGLYGLLAYTIARRTSEIGIRMALGATRGDVTGMVLRSTGWLVAFGLAAGAPIALWIQRFAAAMLENLQSGGTIPIVAATVALIAVALAASYVPVRRAVRVDPLTALRSE